MQMNKIIISVITLKTKTFLWIHVDLARKKLIIFLQTIIWWAEKT